MNYSNRREEYGDYVRHESNPAASQRPIDWSRTASFLGTLGAVIGIWLLMIEGAIRLYQQGWRL